MTLVLVVDDVPALAEQYAYDLRRMGGYEVLVAGDGQRALEVLGTTPVDCVILDLEMPVTDLCIVPNVGDLRSALLSRVALAGVNPASREQETLRFGRPNSEEPRDVQLNRTLTSLLTPGSA